jgi:putative transcriptional regulator
MPRASRNVGLEILQGIRELKRGEHGRVTTVPSITAVREKTGLSQAKFAKLLGVSVRTLQEWEQGRRAPSGAARTLLLKLQRTLASCSTSPKQDDPRRRGRVRAAIGEPCLIDASVSTELSATC